MIGHEYTLTNEDGDSVKFNPSNNPDNKIALQRYPDFSAGVRRTEQQKEGQHGIRNFFTFYNKQVITFEGIIVGTSEAQVETLKEKLAKVVGLLPQQPTDSREGLVTIQWTDANNNSWEIDAQIDGRLRFNRPLKFKHQLDFLLTMKAPDPFIRSQTATTLTGTRGWQDGQLIVPTKVPFTIGFDYQNKLKPTNSGNMDADTTIKLKGSPDRAINNPKVENLTTGKSMKVNVTLSDETEFVEMDSSDGTVVDHNGNDVSGSLASGSEFLRLRPDQNELVYTSDEGVTDDNPTAGWEITYRDTKLHA